MNDYSSISLDFPQDFRVACKIIQVPAGEVLQQFINHVSFYAAFGGKVPVLYSRPHKIFTEYQRHCGGMIPVMRHEENREAAIESIKKLIKLITTGSGSPASKRQRSKAIVHKWYEATEPVMIEYPLLCINRTILLNLTEEFCLHCELHQCKPEEILQFFMDHVSFAKSKALSLLGREDEEKAAMAFFLLLMLQYDQEQKERKFDVRLYEKYLKRLEQLDRQLLTKIKGTDDEDILLLKAEEEYRRVYTAWYNEIQPTE